MMGTLVRFTLIHDDPILANAAIAEAVAVMQKSANTLTIYGEDDNAIKQFNRSIPAAKIILPQAISKLLEYALDVQEQSSGAFSPLLGKLNIMWGFSLAELPIKPPPAAQLLANLKQLKKADIYHKNRLWWRDNDSLLLDFGAIAKGYVVDEGIKILRAHGIHNAIINAGGDMRIIGYRGKRDWKIGIRHPDGDGKVLGSLKIHGNASVVTSGDYERFFDYKGQRFHHIINPDTAYPAMGIRSATVISFKSTAEADAWSTALFVRGAKLIPELEKHGMLALLYDVDGKLIISKKLESMFNKVE
ncbi:MAG: FAD:protein FMN transferase [Mariprofundales bacterium]